MIKITDHQFSRIINNFCACGGRGPDDNPCPACGVYHAIMAEQDDCDAVDEAIEALVQERKKLMKRLGKTA